MADFLASNIKILREERRLSIEEFASLAGVSVDIVRRWEEGTLRPLTRELMVICPILRISEEDILERDIVSERQAALKRMKSGNARTSYNWYYGDRNLLLFYVLAMIIIPVVGVLAYLVMNNAFDFSIIEQAWYEQGNSGPCPYVLLYKIVYPIAAMGIANLVFVLIEAFKRWRLQFRYWYIFIALSLGSLLIVISVIGIIPFWIYCFYKAVFKRGKNH